MKKAVALPQLIHQELRQGNQENKKKLSNQIGSSFSSLPSVKKSAILASCRKESRKLFLAAPYP
jgi:hypothetical protein